MVLTVKVSGEMAHRFMEMCDHKELSRSEMLRQVMERSLRDWEAEQFIVNTERVAERKADGD